MNSFRYKKHKLEALFSDQRWLIVNYWLICLLILAFRKDSVHLHWHEVLQSINYVSLVIVINYFLFPRFYENGKIGTFTLSIIVGIFTVGYIEEVVIEQLLYYDPQAYPIANPGSIFVQSGIPAFIFIVIKLMIYFREKQLTINRLEKEKSESQLQFLRSQINPHILFNNLNNIYSLSEQQDPRTSETILKLSDIIRYALYESTEDRVLLSKELNYLADYIELQKIQVEGRGSVKFEIEGSSEGYTIAPLLLVPFVENCFKHSMDSQINDIDISIGIRIADNKLFFETKNTFQTMHKPQLSPSGIGLKNTRERLAMLYPDKHQLDINQENDLYVVQLEVDLI